MKPHNISLIAWIRALQSRASFVDVVHENGNVEYMTLDQYNHRDVKTLRNTRVEVLIPQGDQS